MRSLVQGLSYLKSIQASTDGANGRTLQREGFAITRRVAVTVALVVCGTIRVQAEPILLAEFSYDSGPQFMPGSQLPNSVNFFMTAHLGVPDTFIMWETNHTPTDIGSTIVAPPEIVAGIANVAASPNAIFFMGTSGVGTGGQYDELLPPMGSDRDRNELRLRRFVQDIKAYRVTGVERTLNNVILQWVPGGIGSAYHVGGKQTVSLYGAVVPEPRALLLLLIGVMYICLKRRYL
jgi:hypothetical protein